MINPSNTSRRRFTQIAVSALAATALFGSVPSAHALSRAVKAARDLANTTDIEGISTIAGTNASTIKFSDAKNLTRILVQAISQKSTGSNVTAVNKQDEIAETVAIIIAKVASNPKIAKLSKARTTIAGIITQGIKGAGPLTADLIRDVVASAVLTVSNSTAQTANSAGILAFLAKKPKNLLATGANKKVATNVTAVSTGLTEGVSATAAQKYEDGTKDGAPDLLFIADPETDKRPA